MNSVTGQVPIKNLHTESLSKENLTSFLLGDNALTEKEIDILCKRKSKNSSHGLSSNEIMVYLYLKMHSSNGWCRFVTHEELVSSLDISERDIYHVLPALEEAKLIRCHGKKYSHCKDIRIYHTGVKKRTRFLSLNRTYFREGEKDYDKFTSLRAGTKSLLLYILFKEKFKEDVNGNVIELDIKHIAKYMRVKKSTVIEYIKELNTVWKDFLIIYKTSPLHTTEEKISAMNDKRVRYGSISSKSEKSQITKLQNESSGFWRNFDLWLSLNNIKERTCQPRLLYDASTHGSNEDKIKRNRERFFELLYLLATKGVSAFDMYKKFVRLIRETGYFDESTTTYMTQLLPNE